MTDAIQTTAENAPRRQINLAQPSICVEQIDDGGLILRSRDPLQDYDRQVGVWLRRWGKERPDKIFLGEREASGDWHTVTYAEARKTCNAISQSLLDRGLGQEKPLMILSENSINFALIALAAMQVGIPVAPISPSYSLVSDDFARLKLIAKLLNPGLIYVEDGSRFEKALKAIDTNNCEIVVSRDAPDGIKVTDFQDLVSTIPGSEVEQAFETVTPDHIAKYLFTSGSTGMPKAVINTQRMLCANLQMTVQVLRFLADTAPVVVDWLPWHHTAAGNLMFNIVLSNGGSYYIDNGKPVPGLFDQTIANLREISPTLYFNVPAGFNALLPYLENDKSFRQNFFKDLQFIWYAAAALSQDIWDRVENVAFEATGERIVLTSSFGTTESSPCLTFAHWHESQLGNVGVPLPGCEIKLAPVDGKLEIRAKGINISPGYLGEPELTADSRDEDGFFKFGDAMRLLDPDDPAKGLIFDGRLSENFKLTTGSWVNVGTLRTDIVAAAAPMLQDLVICGHDRDYIAILAWLSVSGCQEILVTGADTDLATLVKNSDIRVFLSKALASFNLTAGGSSRIIRRAILMNEPAQIDAGEITDKGYINQRLTLERRADLVVDLYSESPSDQVIEIG